MLLYSLTIFLSAFLLFQVQPIIAKMILPWFGGSSAVWSTCMLFFQVVLLLGYLYAHWLHEKLAPRRQAVAHIAALVVSFAALPTLPNPGWKSAGVAHPSLTMLALLSYPFVVEPNLPTRVQGLDLRPVVERAAAAFGKVALVYDFTPDDNDFLCFGCSWTLIMGRATAAAHPELERAGTVLRQERPFRTWTDDFSNMFSILR